MAQAGGYREELDNELKQTDPNSHASRLLAQEIVRLTKGDDEVRMTKDDGEKKERPPVPFIEIHNERPQKISVKVRIPIREHPRYNFVGKLLGPKGQTLKALQEQTGCKMAIMGRGSMREKDKEEELRKEGGKYAHLNEDLHVLVDCFTESIDGYHRLAAALAELRKFVIPEIADDMYGGGDMGMGEMGMNGGGGAPRGRGSFRGGPPERGGRGGFRGGRGAGGPGPVPPPGGRGGAPPSSRGGAPPRGAPRGAPASRGAPPSRGARAAPPPPATSSYDGYSSQVGDGYSSQGYGSGYSSQYDTSYDDGYSSNRGAESSYYDYGASSTTTGYDSYSGGGGYGDYGDGYQAKSAPPSTRGAPRPAARSHPYTRPSQSGY